MELNNKKELDKIWEDEEKILEYERKATIEATKDKVKLFEKLENYLEANNIDEKLQDIVDWYKDKNRWNGLGLFDLIILKSPSKAVYPLGCIYRIGQYLEEGKYHLENICTRGLKGDELDQHFRTKLEVRIDISDIPLRFRIPSKFRWSIKEHENGVLRKDRSDNSGDQAANGGVDSGCESGPDQDNVGPESESQDTI